MSFDIFLWILIPLIFFLSPFMVFLFYRYRVKVKTALTEAQLEKVEQLLKKSAQLEQRVSILESILDSKLPEWRQQEAAKMAIFEKNRW